MMVKAATIVLIPFLLAVMSCMSAQQELTLKEYVRQLESIRQKRADSMDPILLDVKKKLGSSRVIDHGELNREFFKKWVSVIEKELRSLKALKPPTETQASHQALVSSEQELLDVGLLSLNEPTKASSTAELRNIVRRFFSDKEYLSSQAEAACLKIKVIVERKGIQNDLRC